MGNTIRYLYFIYEKKTYTSRKYFVNLNEDIVLFKKINHSFPKIFCKLERGGGASPDLVHTEMSNYNT